MMKHPLLERNPSPQSYALWQGILFGVKPPIGSGGASCKEMKFCSNSFPVPFLRFYWIASHFMRIENFGIAENAQNEGVR
jgi:hypothetical protein